MKGEDGEEDRGEEDTAGVGDAHREDGSDPDAQERHRHGLGVTVHRGGDHREDKPDDGRGKLMFGWGEKRCEQGKRYAQSGDQCCGALEGHRRAEAVIQQRARGVGHGEKFAF